MGDKYLSSFQVFMCSLYFNSNVVIQTVYRGYIINYK